VRGGREADAQAGGLSLSFGGEVSGRILALRQLKCRDLFSAIHLTSVVVANRIPAVLVGVFCRAPQTHQRA